MHFRKTLLAASGALLIALGGLTGIGAASTPALAGSPKPTMVVNTLKIVAVVESTDPSTRQILLSGPDGKLVTLVAGPDIRNFNQIQAGDRLYLTFRRAVAVALVPDNQPMAEPAALIGAHRARKGEMPAGGGFIAIASEVQVDSIDRKAETVTVTNGAGEQHVVDIHDPALQRFAHKLKVGDRVKIEYLQSVTIKLHPDTAS